MSESQEKKTGPTILLVTADQGIPGQIAPLVPRDTLITATADEAARQCRRHDPDLLLIEHGTGDRHGWDLFSELRRIRPELIGLLLVQAPDRKLLRATLAAGFSGILELPLEKDLVRQYLNQVTQQFQLRRENTRLQTLLPLYSLGERFLAASSEKEILDILLEVVAQQSRSSHVSIMLYDDKDACLHIAAAKGLDPKLYGSIRVRPGDQIAGWVFSRGKPVILNRQDFACSPFASFLKRPEIVSAISFPMILRQQILGVVNISLMDGDRQFTESDTEMLTIVCGQAALALDNVRAIRTLEQNVRTRTLFEQYVSREVAEILLTSKSNLLDLGRIQRVTVLFADIRNFTCLVQHLDLDDLRRFLNAFFALFTDTIFAFQGTVDKFIGDAVLAVFGAPISLDNANLNAAQAARRMSALFMALRDEWMQRSPIFKNIDLGIAITCGDIFLGNVGSSQRLDYTVIGNEVNIAQRLAAESCSCRIYITEAVKRDIENHMQVRRMGFARLRGVDQEIDIYSVKRRE